MAKGKHYLTDEQLEYFRGRLLNWKTELLRESDGLKEMLSEKHVEADAVDSACNIDNQNLELRTKDRARKLIHKIDEAIARIDDGTYGYCEETGEPIGLKRLEARPIATLCIEAQERHERMEKDYRDSQPNGK
ncbi:MAG: RNA polymerase-binding protein DksA [Alphaproteobacteria bacterium]|nr:RNA polymerase-binding protein DksA [Alphaproteobacteria bacterium]MBR1480136.1 RNA polymerase-binding protein DksA [Alphaproteobacteria bacterium]